MDKKDSWSKEWTKAEDGSSYASKDVSRPDGGKTEHTLWDKGGTKEDHIHVVVEKDKNDRTERAHGIPNKSKR